MDINKVARWNAYGRKDREGIRRPLSAVVLRHADIVLSEVNAEAASRFLLSQA
jgi:hypothetical protein